MNKRFFAAALTALLTLACHGNAHGHGGFGGGFHGGGAHFAAPRMAAPMYGGFHGGSVGGFRGAGPGFYHGPAYLGSSFHHGPSLNYSRGYAGMNSGAGRLGGYGGFNRAEMTHNLGVANQNVISNRMNAWNRIGVNDRTVLNNRINNINYLHAGWHRGNWNGHYGGWGGNWGGYGRYGGLGYGGYGLGYGYGPGLFGSGLLWGLGTGLGFGLGSSLFGWGLGYGGYGGWGGYGGGLLGWGLPSWSLGTWPYNYGYLSYTNPYYDAIQPVVANAVYDYSQPIPADTSTPPPQTALDTAKASFDAARAAFKSGGYTTALREIDQAIKNLPNDPDLHEFRALTLFALSRYTESAAVLYSVLSVKPGWNWATLIGLYPDVDTFTAQLRTLERHCAEHPNEAPPRFVLAYLYLTMGATDAAAEKLRAVVKLQPDDRLSAQLLADLTSTSQTGSPPSNPEPAQSETSSTLSPPPGDLTGTWTAKGAGGATVELTLKSDGHFTWSATVNGKTRSFSGQYTAGEGLLTLVSDNGPAIVGRITGVGNGFNFKLIGSGPGDPGLTFAR